MTKKELVKNYVISLILGRHITQNSKIPSELELARIHNCSRYPVREALKELTYANWIQPQKGRGYFASSSGDYEATFAKGAYSISKTTVRAVRESEAVYLSYIQIPELRHTKIFVKEYFKKKQLIMKTINNVNNAYLFGLRADEVKRGFIQALVKNQIPVSHQNRVLKLIELTSADQKTFA